MRRSGYVIRTSEWPTCRETTGTGTPFMTACLGLGVAQVVNANVVDPGCPPHPMPEWKDVRLLRRDGSAGVRKERRDCRPGVDGDRPCDEACVLRGTYLGPVLHSARVSMSVSGPARPAQLHDLSSCGSRSGEEGRTMSACKSADLSGLPVQETSWRRLTCVPSTGTVSEQGGGFGEGPLQDCLPRDRNGMATFMIWRRTSSARLVPPGALRLYRSIQRLTSA